MSTAPADVIADLAPSGRLRASINLGNPVLAQGTASAPTGVTVDLARAVADRLGVPVYYTCFDAARLSFQAVVDGRAELCFLAVEPAREAEIAFTAPYALIEGVFAVPRDSPIAAVADVDRDGVRIGVKRGSAYDLYLSRTLERAEVVRGDDGIEAFRSGGLDVAAGIRAPLSEYVTAHEELRLLDGRFMQIEQAIGVRRTQRPRTVAFLRDLVEELKRSGFVADSLIRSGQSSATVAGQ